MSNLDICGRTIVIIQNNCLPEKYITSILSKLCIFLNKDQDHGTEKSLRKI